MKEKSIFEQIINKDILSDVLYEDEKVISIVDINPKRLGHVLIIPKIKKQNILEEDSQTIALLFEVAKIIKQAILKVLNAKGFKLISNINSEGGQVIFHTHLHLIPYYSTFKENEYQKMTSDQIELLKLEIKKII